MADDALRVLAVATRAEATPENAQRDLTFLGLVGMIDPPRPEARDAIATCEHAGIAVVMMGLLLIFLFRVRWRLLPLGVVLLGCVWTFGIAGYLDIPLSVVTAIATQLSARPNSSISAQR